MRYIICLVSSLPARLSHISVVRSSCPVRLSPTQDHTLKNVFTQPSQARTIPWLHARKNASHWCQQETGSDHQEVVVSHSPNPLPGPIPCPIDSSVSGREDELPLGCRRENSIDHPPDATQEDADEPAPPIEPLYFKLRRLNELFRHNDAQFRCKKQFEIKSERKNIQPAAALH